MVKGLLFGLLGVLCLLSIGFVSATSLQTDVNEQLIIRATCSGANAVSDIQIYDSLNELYVPRTLMTPISASDFVFTTSFWQEGTYRAEIECTFGDGFHSFETILIDVTPQNNMILPSNKLGYDYEALLGYNVYFKSDATSNNSILFDINTNEVSFQPSDLSLSGISKTTSCIDPKIQKLAEKRAREDLKLAEKRAKEDAKLIETRAREDEKLVKDRAREDSQLQKIRCKKDSKGNNVMTLSQMPMNNGISLDNNKFTYNNVYGVGTDLQYRVNKDYVKEELVIANVEALPVSNLSNTTLSLNSIMTTTDNIIVDGNVWNMVNPINTSNKILIKDSLGNTIYQLEIPVAFDSNGAKIVGTYTLTKLSSGVEVSVKMPYSWFTDSSRLYPVYLDPTVVWDGTSNLNGLTPQIIVDDLVLPINVSTTFSEIIMWGNYSIVDAECELWIIDDADAGTHIDFRSFYNNQGIMEYTWTPDQIGSFTLQQYCWHGETLDLNKIYSNSSIQVI